MKTVRCGEYTLEIRTFFLKMVHACILIVATFAFVNCTTKTFSSDVDIKVVQNLTEFWNKNVGINLKPLSRDGIYHETSNKSRIIHRFGNRVNGK